VSGYCVDNNCQNININIEHLYDKKNVINTSFDIM